MNDEWWINKGSNDSAAIIWVYYLSLLVWPATSSQFLILSRCEFEFDTCDQVGKKRRANQRTANQNEHNP